MKTAFTLVAFAMMFSVGMAIDTPETFLRGGEDSRELAGCKSQLSTCKANVNGQGQATEDLEARLKEVPEARVTLANKIGDVVTQSATVDLKPLVQGIKGLSRRTRDKTLTPGIRDFLGQLNSITIGGLLDVIINSILSIVTGLGNLISTVVGFAMEWLTGLVAVVVDVVMAVLQVPGALLQLLQQIVAGILGFVINLVQTILSIVLNTSINTNCASSLLECQYTSAVSGTVPDLISVIS